MNKKIAILLAITAFSIAFNAQKAYASLTKEQSDDVAEFATTFISEGNARRDDNGYPLLVYALSNNWNTCVEIRSKGYNSELYYIKNNRYHGSRELGYKWCMDCGDFMAYVYKTTCGFDLVNPSNGDPWHITDFRDDANKGKDSKYFEYVYKNVAISSIDESKLMPGDLILRFGPKDNHGLVYIDKGWKQAHASYNAIRYDLNPPLSGFQVVNGFYKTSTIISVIRVKDGVVPEDFVINSEITWPDTGETQILTQRQRDLAELKSLEEQKMLLDIENDESFGDNIIVENEITKEDVAKAYEHTREEPILMYIEKEMYAWMTDGLKRFYDLSENEEAKKI